MLGILKKGINLSGDQQQDLPDSDGLVVLAVRRAENLFTRHGLSCSEAVLLVMNLGFGGGLSAETCLGLGSGFGGGIGNAGCTCGALSGAVMTLGLFLGPGQPGGMNKKDYRKMIASLHNRFRERSGSVCCRELIADFRNRRSERKKFCSGLTGWIAGETAGMILQERPDLAMKADLAFLHENDSRVTALLKRFSGSGPAPGK